VVVVRAEPGDPLIVPPSSAPPDLPETPDVTLVIWPQDEELRRQLVLERRPRLLLISTGEAPPVPADELEDWMRFPIDREELANRTTSLAARARDVRPKPVGLRLDADGVLHAGGRWVALAPRERDVLAEMLDRPGHLVQRDVLSTAAWPDDEPGDDRALSGVIKRLRRRVAPLGVTIATIPRQGYLLDYVPDVDDEPDL
jgi:hypothetical protein